MTQDIEVELRRKERVANLKLMKDAAEVAFKIVQMWVVLALVVFFQRQTGATLATVVMWVLTAALLVYSYVTPAALLEEWQGSRGRESHVGAYLIAFVVTALAALPLMFSDPIIEEMNRISHAHVDKPSGIGSEGMRQDG